MAVATGTPDDYAARLAAYEAVRRRGRLGSAWHFFRRYPVIPIFILSMLVIAAIILATTKLSLRLVSFFTPFRNSLTLVLFSCVLRVAIRAPVKPV